VEKINSYGKIATAPEDADNDQEPMSGRGALASWVIAKIEDWEDHRDTNYKDSWGEYYRLWRGIWTQEDKTRDSERSQLISPALQQAVEAAVAEQEEATFGKEAWFDVSDDVVDQHKEDMVQVREKLLEDFEQHGITGAISEVFLNAALYGTGIGKIVVEQYVDKSIASRQTPEGKIEDGVVEVDTVRVKLLPIMPENFVIDTAVTRSGQEGIEQALGCACIHRVPRHTVEAKMNDGEGDVESTYYDVELGSPSAPSTNSVDSGDNSTPDDEDAVEIIEYYGKVPKELLEASEKEDTEAPLEYDESDLVEVYITIANRSVLLRAYENPNIMGDRPVVAYAFDIVPNRFWGRGIAEKAYNPQKALDGILRAQMDGLALTVHPMMAADATRIPRGVKLTVRPGKMLLTNGNPNEVLKEFRFGAIDPMSYNATGDLERMIQMATGAMDSASPLKSNRRNETASGMSMIMGGTLKRSKRILQNIERNFLTPLITKTLWRYMQFVPTRYPAKDYKFTVRGTLGMMAREVEQQQLTSLLGFVPPESPPFFGILKGIINSSSIENKEEIMSLVDMMLQPPDPQQQAMKQAETENQLERDVLEKEEVRSRIVRNYAKVKQDHHAGKLKTLQALQGNNKGGK
jgi:hypothetical protein